ncbi:hypothetical protein IFM89_034095 [Coptis chinensis]|uniref:Uncharacterized protein n=1 Tax=Coptis chinensis TaxID=261450 RepID=A0A835H1C5_9MAGN|nr:hypothetical protein IFM89_034095 [Coptis chinensis]
MGRSRGPTSVDEELNQRSKRKRAASSGENLESSATGPINSSGDLCQWKSLDFAGFVDRKPKKSSKGPQQRLGTLLSTGIRGFGLTSGEENKTARVELLVRGLSCSGESSNSAQTGFPTFIRQETTEGKKALYHCNYCNKDISGKIRVKCVKCPDFDLCVECFSVGAEVTPHKSNHPYRVMDNLSFPLICPDWNADEEILLLEVLCFVNRALVNQYASTFRWGIEMYGMGNWTEVAEHVGTKSKALCIDHYTNAYMNSPCFPLPDMSHVIGKNRKELLAMAKGHGQGRKGFPTQGELPLKEESAFSPLRVKIEDSGVGRSPSSLTSDSGVGSSSTVTAATGAVKKASDMAHIKDGSDPVKLEASGVGRGYVETRLKPDASRRAYNTKFSVREPEQRTWKIIWRVSRLMERLSGGEDRLKEKLASD